MTAARDWRPIIRALEYPTLFTPDPLDDVDRILAMIERGHLPVGSPHDVIEAIAAALASEDDLTTLNGAPSTRPGRRLHPFLVLLKEKLEQKQSPPAPV